MPSRTEGQEFGFFGHGGNNVYTYMGTASFTEGNATASATTTLRGGIEFVLIQPVTAGSSAVTVGYSTSENVVTFHSSTTASQSDIVFVAAGQ